MNLPVGVSCQQEPYIHSMYMYILVSRTLFEVSLFSLLLLSLAAFSYDSTFLQVEPVVFFRDYR